MKQNITQRKKKEVCKKNEDKQIKKARKELHKKQKTRGYGLQTKSLCKC